MNEKNQPPQQETSKVRTGKIDPFLEPAIRKHPSLDFHVSSSNEHCIYKAGEFRRGSILIRQRYSGYRLQTTGQAQRLDNEIETLCGVPIGAHKASQYKYWYIDDAHKVEKIIDIFGNY